MQGFKTFHLVFVDEIHSKIKTAATKNKMSMTEYLMTIIQKQLDKE